MSEESEQEKTKKRDGLIFMIGCLLVGLVIGVLDGAFSPPDSTDGVLSFTRKNLVEAAAQSPAPAPRADSVPANGHFNADNVPLGLERETFERAVSRCKITPETVFAPVLGPLTTYDPPIEEFFPATNGVFLGISVYFDWVGALNVDHVSVLKMKCDSEQYWSFFSKKDEKLLAYSKIIMVDGPTIALALDRVEQQLKKKCKSSIRHHTATYNDESLGQSTVLVRYCRKGPTLIAASANQLLEGPSVLVEIAYISGTGWKRYLTAVASEKSKKNKSNSDELSDDI